MKTIKKRIETLEERNGPKPFLVLWGDWDNPDICHVEVENGDPLPWASAKERFGQTHNLICVQYVEKWRNDE